MAPATESCARMLRSPAGHILLEIPWKQADRLQEFFRARDLSTTLHLNPQTREAWLEVRNAEPWLLEELLREWQG